jgi:hypothetical protein
MTAYWRSRLAVKAKDASPFSVSGGMCPGVATSRGQDSLSSHRRP